MKKLISVLLTFATVLSICVYGAVAVWAEGRRIGKSDVFWSYDASLHILHFTGEGVIPDYNEYEDSNGNPDLKYPWKDLPYTEIDFGKGITGVGNYAFCYSDELKSVSVPATVTALGQGVFYNCPALESAVISAACTGVPENTFSACDKLRSVTVKSGTVTSVGSRAFYNCKQLKDISLPESVVTIGSYAFNQCINLESITLPGNLKTVKSYAFYCCERLKEVIFDEKLETVEKNAFLSCRVLTGVELPYLIKSIGEKAFGYRTSSAKVSGFTVTGFENSKAQSYAQENGFEFISLGKYYSGSCGESIMWDFDKDSGTLTLSGSGETPKYKSDSLPAYARFKGKITKIVIDPKITGLGSYSLYNLGQAELDLTGCTALTSIGAYALYNTGEKNLTVPKEITVLGQKAIGFYNKGVLRDDFGISCYYDSTAYRFAKENGMAYTLLDSPGTCPQFDFGESLKYSIDAENGTVYLFEVSVTKESIEAAVTDNLFSDISVSSDIVGTGTKLTLTYKEKEFVFSFVIPGDTDGDGVCNSSDALAALNHSVEKVPLDGAYFTAGDLDKSGDINSSDALKILQLSVGMTELTEYMPAGDGNAEAGENNNPGDGENTEDGENTVDENQITNGTGTTEQEAV